MAENYVDNKTFYQLIKDYKAAKKANPRAKIPDSIGNILILIAQKLSTRFNFFRIHLQRRDGVRWDLEGGRGIR